MLTFDLKKSGRKCFEDQRDFLPGELFFSALVETGDGTTERRDFCETHWPDEVESCIGWWKARVPEVGKGKIYWAPRNVMLAYFEHVLQNRESQDVAFVAGLLLVQKKILVLDETQEDSQTMILRDRVNKATYQVPMFHIEGSRLHQIQSELSEQLFTDEPVDQIEGDEIDE